MSSQDRKLQILEEALWEISVALGTTSPEDRVVYCTEDSARESLRIGVSYIFEMFRDAPEIATRKRVIDSFREEIRSVSLGDEVGFAGDSFRGKGIVVGINPFDDTIGVRWPSGAIEWFFTNRCPRRTGAKSRPRVEWDSDEDLEDI